MLSLLGWLNGILVTFTISFTIIFGSWFMYKSIKIKAKLLFYESLMIIIGWLFLLGICIDFFVIILTGENIAASNEFIRILSYIWLAPATIPVYYVGTKILLQPDKKTQKWLILTLAIILLILLVVFLILDPMGSVDYIFPERTGEDLIDDIIVFGSPFSIVAVFLSPYYVGFCGIGFLRKSRQSEGVIRKKYLLISIGIFLLSIGIAFEAFISLGPGIIFVRLCFLFSAFCWYFALREESAESKKEKPKKELKVEASLFRLTEKPDYISEEEVTFHKEKKICLVCKGSVSKLLYMCSECNVLYCVNCFNALSNAENVCWVCDTVLDDSKPFTSFKETKKEIAPEKIEDEIKKPKNSN